MNPHESDSMLPTAELRDEHRIIEKVLRVLDRLTNQTAVFEASALGECVEFFRFFADACHHGKEENILFPALERSGMPRAGGPISVMLHEHMLGRRLVTGMAAALPGAAAGDVAGQKRFRDTARAYIELLTSHIWKEDNVLFRMSEHLLHGDEAREVGREFCRFRCQAFEGQRREQLTDTAERLAARWLMPS